MPNPSIETGAIHMRNFWSISAGLGLEGDSEPNAGANRQCFPPPAGYGLELVLNASYRKTNNGNKCSRFANVSAHSFFVANYFALGAFHLEGACNAT